MADTGYHMELVRQARVLQRKKEANDRIQAAQTLVGGAIIQAAQTLVGGAIIQAAQTLVGGAIIQAAQTLVGGSILPSWFSHLCPMYPYKKPPISAKMDRIATFLC